MNTTTTTEGTAMITVEQVVKTYNGLDGCACGCGGDYAYPANSTEESAEWGTRSDLRVKRRVNWINKCLTQGEVYVLDFGSEVMYEVMEGSRVTRVYVRSNRLSLADALREAFPCVECGGRGGYAVADRNGEYDGEFSCFSCDGVRVPAMSTSGGQDNPWA